MISDPQTLEAAKEFEKVRACMQLPFPVLASGPDPDACQLTLLLPLHMDWASTCYLPQAAAAGSEMQVSADAL
jgi:hypothetical protein